MESTLTNTSARKPLAALVGFALYGVFVTVLVILLFRFKQLPWPFHGADTLLATYGRVVIYVPFFILSILSVVFLKIACMPVWENIAWRQFSGSFFLGLTISIGYACYLYWSNRHGLKGIAFVPPAVGLSLLNAISEEVVFRLVLYQLLLRMTGSEGFANGSQALVYGLPHLFIGGVVFFLYAVLYGFILGWVTKTNKSILPAIVCHFAIDIGAIGLPLLILI